MKRAGLQEKSSLEVVDYVEYNGAASAHRSFPASKWCRGRGDAGGSQPSYLMQWIGEPQPVGIYGNRWMSASQVVAF